MPLSLFLFTPKEGNAIPLIFPLKVDKHGSPNKYVKDNFSTLVKAQEAMGGAHTFLPIHEALSLLVEKCPDAVRSVCGSVLWI